MTDSAQVLRALADGRFISGEELAGMLGCSRSAVWKHVSRLRKQAGIRIDAVTGRGYRLADAMELLDQENILAHIAPVHRERLSACHVRDVVSSTNELALQAATEVPVAPMAWFAEAQTGGRGRRGRSWYSPYGRNLYFSLLQHFDLPLHRLAGLSLAVGVEIAERLALLGLQGHGLKWPNDLHWNDRKLAGILIEANGEAEGPAHAVIGVGLNVDLGDVPEWLDQPVCCLREAGVDVSRNRLAGELLEGMLEVCQRFSEDGLAPYVQRWKRFGLYQGKSVRLSGPGQQQVGILRGVSADGGLRLDVEGRERTFYGGELSLRPGGKDG